MSGSFRHFLSTTVFVLRESVGSFQKNHAMEAAATLSYYALLALIPLFLLSVILLSRFLLASDEALSAVAAFSARNLPDLGEVLLREVRTLSEQRVWTSISLLVLLGLITPFAATCRTALGRAFISPRSPTYLQAKLRDVFGALTVLGLFLVVVLGKILWGWIAGSYGLNLSKGMTALNRSGSFLLVFLGLGLFYTVFMPMRLRWVQWMAGALAATVLLFLLRPAFGVFLRFNPDYGFAFGSLKAIFILIMWGYISFGVILFGAEVIANVRRRDAVLLRSLLDPASSGKTSPTLVHKFRRVLGPGDIVFREEEPGHVMYVIRSGDVILSRAGQTFLTLQAGDFFGEMTMLLDAPRSATASVGPNGAELIEIARENFDLILRENPRVVEALLRQLALRLRNTDAMLASRLGAQTPGEKNLSNPSTLPEEAEKNNPFRKGIVPT